MCYNKKKRQKLKKKLDDADEGLDNLRAEKQLLEDRFKADQSKMETAMRERKDDFVVEYQIILKDGQKYEQFLEMCTGDKQKVDRARVELQVQDRARELPLQLKNEEGYSVWYVLVDKI